MAAREDAREEDAEKEKNSRKLKENEENSVTLAEQNVTLFGIGYLSLWRWKLLAGCRDARLVGRLLVQPEASVEHGFHRFAHGTCL